MNFQQILELEKDLGPNQGLMAEMNTTGDSRIIWDRHNPDEVQMARDHFNAARRKGMAAYRVTGKEGVRGEVIAEFDPDAERIILAPPLRGGSGEIADILRRARALIQYPANWIKHSMRSLDRYCLVGAIIQASNGSTRETLTDTVTLVKATMGRLYPLFNLSSLECFNDCAHTEHRDILRVLDAAIAEVETTAMWSELNAMDEQHDKAKISLVPEVDVENVGVR